MCSNLTIKMPERRHWRYLKKQDKGPSCHSVNTIFNETENVSIMAPKIWDLLPDKLKNIESLLSSKKGN